jgi:para-nitrobenzyl esterase
MKQYPAGAALSPAAARGDAESDARFSCYDEMARAGAAKYAPIWGFEMNEPDPAQQLPRAKVTLDNTSYHTSDLAYLFDRDANGPLTGDAEKLARKMRAYWIRFMKTGTPNAKGLPPWPRYQDKTKTVLNLSNAGGVTTDFAKRHRCAPLQEAGLVSYEWK